MKIYRKNGTLIGDFGEKNLRGAYLRGADLQRADLQGTNLYRAYLYRADLQGANLYRAYLYGADLQRADLRGAYLQRANLRGANLREADLQEADLQEADLQEAYLRGVNLQGAKLQGAKLQGADLYGAKNIPHSDKISLLEFLKDQPGKIRAYKLVNKKNQGPFFNSITYVIGQTYSEKNANTDNTLNCAEGISLATLNWCYNNYQDGYKILIAEFEAKDIAAIPITSDGKFRVFKCKIVGEKEIHD